MLENPFAPTNHKVTGLVNECRARRAERVTAGKPLGSPEEEISDEVDMKNTEEQE